MTPEQMRAEARRLLREADAEDIRAELRAITAELSEAAAAARRDADAGERAALRAERTRDAAEGELAVLRAQLAGARDRAEDPATPPAVQVKADITTVGLERSVARAVPRAAALAEQAEAARMGADRSRAEADAARQAAEDARAALGDPLGHPRAKYTTAYGRHITRSDDAAWAGVLLAREPESRPVDHAWAMRMLDVLLDMSGEGARRYQQAYRRGRADAIAGIEPVSIGDLSVSVGASALPVINDAHGDAARAGQWLTTRARGGGPVTEGARTETIYRTPGG